MARNIKQKVEESIWGKKEKPYSLSKQLSRLITYCCVIAITIQSIVMVGMIIKQYVQQEKEDTLYILENDNGKMEVKIQYLEEMVLTIKRNLGLRSFFVEQIYNKDTMIKQLENAASVFSERNRMENSEPFVEKIYLFNLKGESISNLYYPITVSEYDVYEKKYHRMYNEFEEEGEDFYFQVEEDHINLCLSLYDDKMEKLGGCIFALNRKAIENNYHNLEEMGRFSWSIKKYDQVLLEKSNLLLEDEKSLIENSFNTGFGLTFSVAISEFVILESLWTTVLITFLTAVILIVILAFFPLA